MDKQQKKALLQPHLNDFLNEIDHITEYKVRTLDNGCVADFEFSPPLFGILELIPEITISAIEQNQKTRINILILLYAGPKHLQWNGMQIINKDYLINEQRWGEWTWHFDEFSEFSQPSNNFPSTQENIIIDKSQSINTVQNAKALLEKYFKTKFQLTTNDHKFQEFTSNQYLGSLQLQIKVKIPLNSLRQEYLVTIYFQGKQLDYGYKEGNWVKFTLEEQEKKTMFKISGYKNIN